jgi:putative transposase
MARKKRHSREEIAAKLVQAKELSAQGQLQSEIARTLGVSVMTLHRWRNAPWRNAPPRPHSAVVVTDHRSGADQTDDQSQRISELQIENSRLRQIVTDLLLEKVKLEEASNGPKTPTKRASR